MREGSEWELSTYKIYPQVTLRSCCCTQQILPVVPYGIAAELYFSTDVRVPECMFSPPK